MKLAPAEHLHSGPGHSAKLPRSGLRSSAHQVAAAGVDQVLAVLGVELVDRCECLRVASEVAAPIFGFTLEPAFMTLGRIVALAARLIDVVPAGSNAVVSGRANLPASCVGAVVTATGDAIDLASAATGLAGHVSLEVIDIELATDREAVSVAWLAFDLVGGG